MPKDTPASPPAAAAVPNETAEAIRQLAAAFVAQQPPSPLDQLGLSPERQKQLLERMPGRRYRTVKIKSDTGATFDLVLCEGKKGSRGVGVWFSNYLYPSGMYIHQAAGGRVPDGLPILKDSDQMSPLSEGQQLPSRLFTRFYSEWRRQTFYLADHRTFVGSEIRAHHLPEDAPPWSDPVGSEAA